VPPSFAGGVGSGSRGPGLSLCLLFARQARLGGARALGGSAMAGHGPFGKAQLTKLEVAPVEGRAGATVARLDLVYMNVEPLL
jgi:hypothetical protein